MTCGGAPKANPLRISPTVEALLKRAIAADPALYEAHYELGILYQDQQKYQDAIRELNQTVALRPDFNRAHYRLFLLYSRTHQKQLADEHLAILKQIKQEDAAAEEAEDNPMSAQAKPTPGEKPLVSSSVSK